VILAVLGALGVLNKLTATILKYHKQLTAAKAVLREVFAVGEAISRGAASAGARTPEQAAGVMLAGQFLKQVVKNRDASRGDVEQAIVRDASAEAEKRTGHNGSATTANKIAAPVAKTKGQRIRHGIGTALKFAVGFIPGVGVM
jgi:hypothetical protein